jgi:hypothetical protein
MGYGLHIAIEKHHYKPQLTKNWKKGSENIIDHKMIMNVQ